VDIVAPCQIVYVTLGPNNQFRWETPAA